MDQAQQLRNVIKLHNQKNVTPARVITITSGKGGVGKSNLAVNLAVQLSKKGKKVIILDADFGLANVEVMFGTIPKYSLADVIYNGKPIKEIISQGPNDIGFISGGSGIMGLNSLSKDKIKTLIRSMSEIDALADIVLIDTGAGISDQVMEFVVNSPEILLVTTPEPSSLTDSYSLLKALYKSDEFSEDNVKIHVLANKVTSQEDGVAVFDKLNSVVEQFLNGNLDYIGVIPQDTVLERAVRRQKIVSITDPKADSSRAFEILADNLLEGTHHQVQFSRGLLHFLSNFFMRKGWDS